MIDELCYDARIFVKLTIVLLIKEKFEEISDHFNEKSSEFDVRPKLKTTIRYMAEAA
jgi:hypothetical protein